MRKCIRCKCEMRENYDVKVEGGAYGLKITKQGIFKDNLGKVHVAVCPECGYLEFYLEDTTKMKKQATSHLQGNAAVSAVTWPLHFESKPYRTIGCNVEKGNARMMTAQYL